MNNMIFVGGIHGVGKTSFCKKISKAYSLEFYSASALISEIKKEQFSKNKMVEHIN